jgi:hypothetical protein
MLGDDHEAKRRSSQQKLASLPGVLSVQRPDSR